ncbi:MAG: hypothetical protein LBC73_07975 [Oscillospiraceae bacterium]|jgi:hypothetical protein|nr:hypothetical protein [Oscillospiraceae bacterium]
MRREKTRKPLIVFLIIIGIATLCGGLLANNYYTNEIELYQNSLDDADAAFLEYTPNPFINSAAKADPFVPSFSRDDALYFFKAPEGFDIISHSEAWNEEMLELLYHELKLNAHGDEIFALTEIVVYAHEDEYAAATYSPSLMGAEIFFLFPAFPEGFAVQFPRDTGSIQVYDGDNKTTIESIATSLSHEYGHHYTYYYMFNVEMREGRNLENTAYARLRRAEYFDLITTLASGSDLYNHHRFLVEVAAEDYLQLMGSPTTRRVENYVDVQQRLNGVESDVRNSRERNAFPQANMMLPLAIDVPGLDAYFYSFIDAAPRIPEQAQQEITLQIKRNEISHNLTTGSRTFVHYVITWNTPYRDAIYTLAFYDPQNYLESARGIKTVWPGQTASAVIGEYVISSLDSITWLNDEIAHGLKIFFVVAQLPDGTYYISDKLDYDFDFWE